MDDSGQETPVSDSRDRDALRARARRIHVYAAVSGLAYAAWEYARWAV